MLDNTFIDICLFIIITFWSLSVILLFLILIKVFLLLSKISTLIDDISQQYINVKTYLYLPRKFVSSFFWK